MTEELKPATVPSSSLEDDNKTSAAKGVFSYFLLPGIIPQAKELGRSGFGFLAFLIAYLYQGVRILPANHPFTKQENFGTYGIRAVIAEAANHVIIDRKHIDQLVIFLAVLAGLLIMVLQFAAFILMLVTGDAFAAPPAPAPGIFITQYPDTDIAFFMLREVFGIPDMFGTLEGGGPTAFQIALHGLFEFYNYALLIVAAVIFVYYVIVVVAETAQTGTPFGQRFSHIYAPLRLVMAIGLLVPLNYGLNASQYITLYAAKLGSSFATTGWIQFNDALQDTNPLGADNTTLIARTKAPDFDGLLYFMATISTCAQAYDLFQNREIEGRVLFETLNAAGTANEIQHLFFSGGAINTLADANYNKDIKIQFGSMIPQPGDEVEWVPYCGEITIPVSVPLSQSGSFGQLAYPVRAYYDFVRSLWTLVELEELGLNFSRAYHNLHETEATWPPDPSVKTTLLSTYRTFIDSRLTSHYNAAASVADFSMNNETRIRGWGGAGIWYNKLAQINGGYTVATLNAPHPSAPPLVMAHVLDQKKNSDAAYEQCEAYDPNLADNEAIQFEGNHDKNYAMIMNASYQYWSCNNADGADNFLIDAVAAIFGLEGLVSIRDGIDTNGDGVDDVQIHPLAKLSALGRGLIESSIRNTMTAMAASFGGGVANILDPQLGAGLQAASSMFTSIAVIGLSIGFTTYYILPFLPFIYFFFALGGWVKGIFEAMVGAPLWALAHLRIDGDGLPGKMAMNGYFLIFEIFLRPILIVFGLLGGMATFSAMAVILNEIFDLVVANTSGVNLDGSGDESYARNTIDIFFFTIIYAIILYMMALASFKMITLVPNSIIRWLGQSIQAFNDNADDPAANLTSYATIGGNQIGAKVIGGASKLGEAGGSFVGGVAGLGKGG